MNALIVAATTAAVTAAYLIALAGAERFTGAYHLVPAATAITLATATATTAAYLFAPLWWVLIWIAALATATPLVVVKLTRTYPRRRIRSLLVQRLATVLGTDWTKRVALAYTPVNQVNTVTTTLPAAVIPSDITPRLKSVISETLSGTWIVSTQGTKITATRKRITPDPPELRELKAIICGPKAFTATAKISHHHISDDGHVHGFTVTYSDDLATAIALGHRKRAIQTLISERIDPGENNSFSFDWDTVARTCIVKRSVFAARIDHKPPPPAMLASNPQEATRIYPDLHIAIGENELGHPVMWKPVGKAQPHALFVGLTGSGKSSAIMTVLTAATLAGWCVVIVDFKCSTEFDGFRDWPGVHLVTQDIYSNIRAIAYVKELMDRRKSGGTTTGAVATNIPILLIIDEFTICTKTLEELWPRFKKTDKSLPKIAPTIEDAGAILREGRSLMVHELSALQRATADNMPAEFKFNSPFKIQVGHADSTTSYNLWDNAEAGQAIPEGVAGRSLTRGPNGFTQFQGYFTPDPATAVTDHDNATLAALRPPAALYPRMLIDMPDADEIERWDQIVTAPIVSAAARPDLDPLAPTFVPRRVLRVDTTSKIIDAATMQLKNPTNANQQHHNLDTKPESETIP